MSRLELRLVSEIGSREHMPRHVEVVVKVSPDTAALAAATAALFTESAKKAVEARGVARIAVSGGSTPKIVFRMLADPAQPFLQAVPWDRLQLYWVDERCVPPDHVESNYRMTNEAMLSKIPLPAANIHRMEGELDPEEAASKYESEIRNTFKLEGAETPVFDLVLLGMGPDGHTASLFPHTEGLHEMARIVIPNHVPQKDAWRVTLTWPVITAGREVAFLIEGKEKEAMVKQVFTGPYDPETTPAQLIRPASGVLTLMMDVAAATGLPGPPQVGETRLELA
jgi:6-phosphogluconolactonase